MDNEKIQLEKLKKRISRDLFETETEYNNTLEILLEDSKYIALSTLYPYEEDYTNIELPKKYYNWQLRACIELYNLGDMIGTTGYSENQVTISKKTDGLPQSLMAELIPMATAPRKRGGNNV